MDRTRTARQFPPLAMMTMAGRRARIIRIYSSPTEDGERHCRRCACKLAKPSQSGTDNTLRGQPAMPQPLRNLAWPHRHDDHDIECDRLDNIVVKTAVFFTSSTNWVDCCAGVERVCASGANGSSITRIGLSGTIPARAIDHKLPFPGQLAWEFMLKATEIDALDPFKRSATSSGGATPAIFKTHYRTASSRQPASCPARVRAGIHAADGFISCKKRHVAVSVQSDQLQRCRLAWPASPLLRRKFYVRLIWSSTSC